MLASTSFFGRILYFSPLSLLSIQNSSLSKTAVFLLNLSTSHSFLLFPLKKNNNQNPPHLMFLHAHACGLQPFHWLEETPHGTLCPLLSLFCLCCALLQFVSLPLCDEGRGSQFHFCVPSMMPGALTGPWEFQCRIKKKKKKMMYMVS